VFDAGTATYYWDGASLGARTQSLGSGPATVQLGSSAAGSTAEGWIGMLDEVAFYSTALPAADILAHYNAYYIGDPPVVTSQPVGGYYLAGQPLQLSVAATGVELSYQWFKDNASIPGATNSFLGTASLVPTDSGVYYVRVSNASGNTNSALATLQVGNNLPRYQSTVLAETSLISYYQFDAGDGRDAKNAHIGAATNNVTFEPGLGGVTNLAVKLDGSGEVDLGQVSDFEFVSGNGTVEGWIRPDWGTVPAYDPCIFAARDGASIWSIHMSRWKTEIGNWNGDRFQALQVAGVSGWHHYAVTFGANKVAMYWDGKPIGSFAQPINLASGKSTQIGSSAPGAAAEGWLGGLDEVAFYSATLSPETIWNHFLAMVGPESAPRLSVVLNGKQLTLSWPAAAVGYTLESNPSLSAATWTPVSGVLNNQTTVDAAAGMQYFRLKK